MILYRGLPLMGLAILFWAMSTSSRADEPATLKIHMIGVGEYDPAKSLAEFKKHLEKNYRVECTGSLGGNGTKLDNLDALKTADLLIIGARRMNLPEEQMAIIRDHWEKGKPIVAFRCASHAFQPADNEVFSKVLGGAYTGPGSYTAPYKAIAAKEQAGHAVLKGVESINSRGCYGFDKLANDTVVLQFVETTSKTPRPVSWVHTYKGGRTFYTCLGIPEDFQDESFRRLFTNAIFWTAQRDAEKMKK